MANYCHNYFSKIGIDMATKINSVDDFLIRYPPLINSMALNPVNKNELIEHINLLKNNSAPGIDGITSRMLKNDHRYIIEPLMHIINLIFTTGKIPEELKISIINPVFKNGSKKDVSNYRPISLITNFAKMFEKCLKKRLYEYLIDKKILNVKQFGFQKGISTCDAMYELIFNIKNSLENENKNISIFIDLAKAFDTVPHKQLLNVLEHYGIRGLVLKIFENYLHERTQIVKIRNEFSNPVKIQIGVPHELSLVQFFLSSILTLF
ncbi:unnamed protein product [Psylliodes chrysocephalus]|uniref:Reverse transcriptase domain-containing protein n=1 Tax=Psylliodes chrysocephalus TaxID=3402493 RepID=A0A9P0CFN5_9CUCU|nr:unnamed protein product [Psylliodes chrysocephala]